MNYFSIAENMLLTIGVALLSAFAISQVSRFSQAQQSIEEFEHLFDYANAGVHDFEGVNYVLSSEIKDLAFQGQTEHRLSYSLENDKNLTASIDSPLGVLKIERLNINVPVYHGSRDTVLDKGAGWITYTAPIDKNGNIGIAAHRDSFFRPLKDVKLGDLVEVSSLFGARKYRVNKIQIVSPERVDVLKNSGVNQITLVTCYPFYFVGKAPKRFIVSALEI